MFYSPLDRKYVRPNYIKKYFNILKCCLAHWHVQSWLYKAEGYNQRAT